MESFDLAGRGWLSAGWVVGNLLQNVLGKIGLLMVVTGFFQKLYLSLKSDYIKKT